MGKTIQKQGIFQCSQCPGNLIAVVIELNRGSDLQNKLDRKKPGANYR